MKKLKINWAGAAGLVATLIAGGIGLYVESKTSEATQNEFGEAIVNELMTRLKDNFEIIPKDAFREVK